MKKLSPILKNTLNILIGLKNSKLQRKYITLFFFIVFIPILIIFITSMAQYINLQNYQKKTTVSKTLDAAENIVSNSLSAIETYAYFILSDNDVNRFVSSGDITRLDGGVERTRNTLNNALKLNDSLSSVAIYSFKNNYVFGTRMAGYIEDIPREHIPWYDHYKKTGETNFIITASNPSSQSIREICMVRGLHLNGGIYAFVILSINTDTLFSFKGQENYMLIYNPDSSVLYSSGKGSHSQKLDFYGDSVTEFYNNNEKFVSTSRTIYAKSDLSYSNMTLIMLTDNPDREMLYVYIAIIVSLIIATMLLALVLAGYLTDMFYSHIAKTISYLTSESEATYDNTQDELSWIKNSIYQIVNSNKELELELSKSIIKLKNSHLAAMQMQCNPHFLFNALNVANMHIISKLGGNNSASEIIVLVSDLLHAALDTEQYFVTIKEEISFARKYIQIEEIKHNYNFDVIYDVDSSILDCITVKLTMQPIIENAFKYGIYKLPKNIKGTLSISIKGVDDTIVFTISDNGNTDNDTLARVSESLDTDIYTIVKKNIGLKNVNSRIKILFGSKYGCRIFRNNGKTIAQMTIPRKYDTNSGGKQ